MPTGKPLSDSLPNPPTQDNILTAACHCGRVQIQLPFKPEKINECHCTVCYKYGSLWAYFPRSDVVVTVSNDAKLQAYIRTDKGSDGDISFSRCSHCGCMICWWGEGKYAGPEHQMGVNCRMLPENELEDIPKKVSQGPS